MLWGGAVVPRCQDSFQSFPPAASFQHLPVLSLGGSRPVLKDVLGGNTLASLAAPPGLTEARAAAAREDYAAALRLLPPPEPPGGGPAGARQPGPGDAASALLRALCQSRLADYESAARSVLELLTDGQQRGGRQEAAAMAALAFAYERQRRHSEALRECERAISRAPDCLEAWLVQGVAFEQTGMVDQAIRAFEQCLALDAWHPVPKLYLGHCHLLCGDLLQAEPLLRQAIEDSGGYYGTVEVPASLRGAARTYLALLRLEAGATEEAVDLMQQARSEHRNLGHLWGQAEEICAGADGFKALVQQLRGLCDLDLSTAEATKLARLWQLRGGFGAGSRASHARASATAPAVPSQRAAYPTYSLEHGATTSATYAAQVQSAPPGRLSAKPGHTTHTAPSFWMHDPRQAIALQPQASHGRIMSGTPVWLAQVSPASQVVAANGNMIELDAHQCVRPEEIVYGPCLGSGGSGDVFHGTFRGMHVAIKRLQIQASHRMEELWREVDSLRFLRHPRLVQFYGACVTPPHFCVLMEYCEGGSLHDLLHVRRKPLTWQVRRRIALQIFEALAFLHGHSPPVVHRDVKAMNILLDARLEAKLCDFGLTMPMGVDKTHFDRRAGGESGSPRYMAPEFFIDTAKLTEKIDVWAAGCVIIEVFGGPLPLHDCESIQQICARLCVARKGPLIPDTFPPALRAIAQRCLEFDVPRRCSSKDALAWLAQLPAEA